MGLEGILSISGKVGLYKLIGSMKNGVIVESLSDGKRTPAHAHQRISALSDISIYGEEQEKPLREIIKAIVIQFSGEPITYRKWNGKELKTQFFAVYPDYDQDRVYTSDIKKIYQWVDILLENKLIDLEWANMANDDKKEESEDKL